MSKKTRKKSPKASSGKAAGARSKTSAKKASSKNRRATASTSAKKANERAGNASPRASHKAPSKQLKSSGPRASATGTTAGSKPTAAMPAKPRAGDTPASKPLVGKTDAPAGHKSALTEGARAPAFRLPRDGSNTFSLSDYSGKKLVLFFYPRADTPGCTKEAIDFTRLARAFAENQTAILGVSADPPKAQEAFRDKHELSIPLASDEKHEMLEAYGVWGEKSMYGRTFQGILRTTVLIGADGRVIRIWRNVRVDGHADDVLAAVRAS
jgi:thioredoxin-dependent peroxiredoxin